MIVVPVAARREFGMHRVGVWAGRALACCVGAVGVHPPALAQSAPALPLAQAQTVPLPPTVLPPGAALVAGPPLQASAPVAPPPMPVAPPQLSLARAVARDAYVFGVPMVSSYAALYALALDKGGPAYRGPFDTIVNAPAATPDERTVPTPNLDIAYSYMALDLRAEPVVLTVPPIEAGRYYALQFMDLETFNFAYLGTRISGNGGGRYLIAGPRWSGPPPAGVAQVIRADTEFVTVIGRTQSRGPQDAARVRAIQDGFRVERLSTVTGVAAPATPPIDWPQPLTPGEQRSSPRFFSLLAFLLQFAPPDASEQGQRAYFASIGLVPGQPFDVGALSDDLKTALAMGMAEGQRLIDARRTAQWGRIDGLFGTRQALGTDDVARALGAQIGIGANSREEALLPLYEVDAKGEPLDADNARYTLRFAKGALPPVNAFWSMTLYALPDRLPFANPIGRYQIDSAMVPSLKRDADGGITILIQDQPPGGARDANWLPAPAGPFMLTMRYYWPRPELLDGRWPAPGIDRIAEPKPVAQRPVPARPQRAAR